MVNKAWEGITYLLELLIWSPRLVGEELLLSPQYSVPTLLIASVIGLLFFKVTRRFSLVGAWILTGAVVCVLTFVVRIDVVLFSGTTNIPAPNLFAMRSPSNMIYLYFLISGAVAGFVVAPRARHFRSTTVAGMLGIALGTLYHLKLASGWWTRPWHTKVVLLGLEFFGPALFGLVAVLVARTLMGRDAAV